LKQIRRAAGNARDCDVLLIRHEDTSGDRRAQRFIASVRRKRRDAQTPICSVFHSIQEEGGFDRLANRLLAQSRAIHSGETRPRFGPWARKKLKAVASDFFDAQPSDFDDLPGMHEFRIAGKRLRYTMELLSSAFPTQLQDELYPVIEQMQESLGDINDHAVAIQRFRAWRQGSSDRLERKHLKRLARREQKALDEAIDYFAEWWTPKRARKLRKQFRRLTTPA
jgi:CHAD domain-containing protein